MLHGVQTVVISSCVEIEPDILIFVWFYNFFEENFFDFWKVKREQERSAPKARTV